MILEITGAAFISLAQAPKITESTASIDPLFNPNFDGANNINLFDGMSGWLKEDEKICIEFAVELSPASAINDEPLEIQATVAGVPTNVVGERIPDLVNGGNFIISDLSDAGREPGTG